MAKWIIDRTINLDEYKTRQVLLELLKTPRPTEDEMEKTLHQKKVLKNEGDGALRRRWFTYLRNYGLMKDDDVTEMGKIYSKSELSLCELALLQLIKKRISIDNGNLIFPFKVLVLLFKELSEFGANNLYITREEFINLIVNITDDSFETINKLAHNILETRKNNTLLDYKTGEHDDIWFNTLRQTNIFKEIGHSLFVENEGLFQFICKYYEEVDVINDKYGDFNSSFINYIPTLDIVGGEFKFNEFLKINNCTNALEDLLFSSKTIREVDETYFSKSSIKSLQLLNLLDLAADNVGKYRIFANHKGIVALKLSFEQNDKLKTIGFQLLDNIKLKNAKANNSGSEFLSVEWFKNEANDFIDFNEEARKFSEEFKSKYGSKELLNIDRKHLAEKLFLGKIKKDNLMYVLERNESSIKYFARYGGGPGYSYNYPCFYNDGSGQWITGSSRKHSIITEEEANNLALETVKIINDSCDIIDKFNLNGNNDYENLYNDLKEKIGKFVDKTWLIKYFTIMYPHLFAPFYSIEWQRKVLNILKLPFNDNRYIQNGEIMEFVNECDISSPVFAQIIYTVLNSQDNYDTNDEDLTSEIEIDESKRLKGGENVIVYGVPGAGKSHLVKYEYLNGDENEEYYERLVFHPDYTYSDFVGQIMPIVDKNKNVTYDFIPGPFTRLLKKAYRDPGHKYSLVIEEINRGNAAAIFGDIFQLLDRKTDGESDYRITNKDIARVVYGDNRADEKIYIPSNMSIICTMNTSDQNVFTLDTAFQRRWIMRLVSNSFEGDTSDIGNVEILDAGLTWEQFCETINSEILDKSQSLSSSEDKRLGTHFVRAEDLKYDPNENSNDQSTKIKAQHQNRLFAEKVIKYLWDDVYKYDRSSLFDSEYKSLEQVINDFIRSAHIERFKIFKQDIRESLQKIAEDNSKKSNQNNGNQDNN